MRKLLRMTILAGLMVLFGAAEDGCVRHQFRASSNWSTTDAHVVRRCRPPYHAPRLQAWLLTMAATTTNCRVSDFSK